MAYGYIFFNDLSPDVRGSVLKRGVQAAFRAKDPKALMLFRGLGADDDESREELLTDLIDDPSSRNHLRIALGHLGGVVTPEGDYEPDGVTQRLAALQERFGPFYRHDHDVPAWKEGVVTHARVVHDTGRHVWENEQSLAVAVVLRHEGRDLDEPFFEPAYALEDEPGAWYASPRIGIRASAPALYRHPDAARGAANALAHDVFGVSGWPDRSSVRSPNVDIPPEAILAAGRAPLVLSRFADGEASTMTVFQASPVVDAKLETGRSRWSTILERDKWFRSAPKGLLFEGVQAARATKDETIDTSRLPAWPSREMAIEAARANLFGRQTLTATEAPDPEGAGARRRNDATASPDFAMRP